MVHQIYDSTIAPRLHTSAQLIQHQLGSGGGVFNNNNNNHYNDDGPYYEGRVFQRGRGFGSYARGSVSGSQQAGDGFGDVMRTVWRFIKPLASSVGKEGMEAGSYSEQPGPGSQPEGDGDEGRPGGCAESAR